MGRRPCGHRRRNLWRISILNSEWTHFMSTRVHLDRECMHFYKVLEYGPGRTSPEQKLRDVNLNFSGALLKKTSVKCRFFWQIWVFSLFSERRQFFIIYTLASTILYFFINIQYYTNNRRASHRSIARQLRRKEGINKIRRILHGRKTRYRHGLPTHDNKNPIFCVIAYSPSEKLSLVQNSICMNLAGLNLWIFYR
jgi:hypothetical protein